jgi:hypothetical protein
MSSITPAAPSSEAAQAWVLAFAEGWLAPASADAFADHFQPWFDPHIRLVQPLLPALVGQRAFRERFARPLFALIPDLHGQVERTAMGADCARPRTNGTATSPSHKKDEHDATTGRPPAPATDDQRTEPR